jgi:hypothetical protein
MLTRRTPSARRLVAGLPPTRLAREQQPFTPRQDDNGRRLIGSTTVATIPRHHLIHGLTVTNVTFFKNKKEKTLAQPLSDVERHIVNPTNVQGPLSIITRPGNLAACRTR